MSLVIAVLTSLLVAGFAEPAAGHAPADPAVVTRWNAIAQRTIFTEAANPIPSSGLYFGFVSLAVHDAVVTVAGGRRPFLKQPRVRGRASAEAAAATAAYDVLRTYFPGSAANLAADHAAALAAIPDGPRKTRGVRAGAAAAARVVAWRTGDGRNNPAITFDQAPAVGVWRPTTTGTTMAVPWLGFVRPLVLRSPTAIRLPGPDPLTSRAYARDYNEVKTYGALTGSARTPEQTETARFWNANSMAQYQEAMRDQVTRRHLGIVATARAFALLGTSTADALIACWRAKYDYGLWRPVTAIHEAAADGNPATAPDPTWTSLLTAPPYPDYISGHACISGAASETFGAMFGRRGIDLTVSSTVTGTSRHFSSARALDTETMNARIWLGFHFRRAMTDGNRVGHAAAVATRHRL